MQGKKRTVGIIGIGHVGAHVAEICCGRYHASGEKTGSDGKGNHICRNGRNLCDIRIVDFHSDAVQSRNLSDFKTVN